MTDELHRMLSIAGITIEELPMLRFEFPADCSQLDAVLHRAAQGEFDYIILSSPTAVNFFEERAREAGMFDAIVRTAKFGAVGGATASELTLLGIETKLPIPMRGGSAELATLFSRETVTGKHVLLLQSQIGLETLERALVEIGAVPERVTLYHTEGPSLGDAARLIKLLESEARPDVIAFFSPSAFAHFIRVLAEMASGLLRHLPAIACIGETTAKSVEESLRRRPEIIARKADQTSLAEDIIRYLKH